MERSLKSHVAGEFTNRLTAHAAERMEERKVSNEALAIILREGDLLATSRGCLRRRVSRKRARRLERFGTYPRRDIVAAREAELILSPEGQIVTCLRHPADMRFRRSGVNPDARRYWKNLGEEE